VPFLCPRWFQQNPPNSFGMNGGDDETRTRDLCRDSSLRPLKHPGKRLSNPYRTHGKGVVPAFPEQAESAGMQHLEKSDWDALIRLSNAIMYFIGFNVNPISHGACFFISSFSYRTFRISIVNVFGLSAAVRLLLSLIPFELHAISQPKPPTTRLKRSSGTLERLNVNSRHWSLRSSVLSA
jgi:hypothetical protein